jgi:uncharacterized cupredoxin-like copper-binding protein
MDRRNVVRNRSLVAAACSASLLLVGSCGGSSDGGEPTGPGTTVTVTETDFAISLSQQKFTPGTYTFQTTNAGQAQHVLEVEGEGMEKKTSELGPGDKAELTVDLKKGRYEIYCPVGDHKNRGMKVEITVE